MLFSASSLHAATIRSGGAERKTVQVYYCHRDRALAAAPLDLAIPEKLLADPAARGLYGAQAARSAAGPPRL